MRNVKDQVSPGLDDTPPVFESHCKIRHMFQRVRAIDKVEAFVTEPIEAHCIAMLNVPPSCVRADQISANADVEPQPLAVFLKKTFMLPAYPGLARLGRNNFSPKPANPLSPQSEDQWAFYQEQLQWAWQQTL